MYHDIGLLYFVGLVSVDDNCAVLKGNTPLKSSLAHARKSAIINSRVSIVVVQSELVIILISDDSQKITKNA